MEKCKIFTGDVYFDHNRAEMSKKINCWLAKQSSKIEVISREVSTTSYQTPDYVSGSGSKVQVVQMTVAIFYKLKGEEN